MNRFDWLARFFRPSSTPRTKREKRLPKEKRVFKLGNLTVEAYTKSEARAMFKRLLRVPRKQRLPAKYAVSASA